MKLYLTLSKKGLFILLLVIIISVFLVGQFASANRGYIDGSTNALRVSYIKSLGLNPQDSIATSKSIIIPEKFNDVYEKYNSLQKRAGFDLSHYKGAEATVYTYPLSDNSNQVHLLVSNNAIIGGDVCSIRIDGEMKPLKD